MAQKCVAANIRVKYFLQKEELYTQVIIVYNEVDMHTCTQ